MIIYRIENSIDDVTDIFYIDAYEIDYIRRYTQNSMPSSAQSETIDMVQLNMTSGKTLEFNLDSPGVSELLQYFYDRVEM
jgi:hypothetical protein